MQILPKSPKRITVYAPDWHVCRIAKAAKMALPVVTSECCRNGRFQVGLLNCHKWIFGDFAESGQ